MLLSYGSFCFVRYFDKALTVPYRYNIKYVHKYEHIHGGLAQLVEHLPCKQGVSGSIPLTSTSVLTADVNKRNQRVHSSAG